MPDDLLPNVIGPTPYSSAWLWLALLLSVALIGWYAAVVVATLPGGRLRDLPVVGRVRGAMVRQRYLKAVRAVGDRYRAGELDAALASAALSHQVRAFLRHETGVRAEFLQLDDIADGELAPAAALLEALGDAQFNDASTVDVGRVSADAEELIRSWT